MIFADAGYFLALLQERDALHARAQAWSIRLRPKLLVTEYVLCETINGLANPSNRPKAAALMDWVFASADCEFVRASPALLAVGASLFRQRLDKEWSLTDCISFHVMTSRGMCEALAHDAHFEQAGFVALLRRDP